VGKAAVIIDEVVILPTPKTLYFDIGGGFQRRTTAQASLISGDGR
jgi:hypothetical protein